MSMIFWRMVNGYSVNPYTGVTQSNVTAPATYNPYVTTPTLPTALTAATPASAATTAIMPKWILPPDWTGATGAGLTQLNTLNQLQYTFLPKMPKKPLGERINKAVKCEVCNITLNSEQQAQQHYNGKNHLKKMKQRGIPLPGEEEGKKILQQYGSDEEASQAQGQEGQGDDLEPNGDSEAKSETDGNATASQGGVSASSTPSSGVNSPPPPAVTPTLQQQQQEYEQQQSETTADGEQNKLDPVSQAVYDNLMGKLPRKRKMEIPCSTCDMIFNSEVQADQHFKGVRHNKRLKMVEEMKNPHKKTDADSFDGQSDCQSPEPSTSPQPDPNVSRFYCHFCNVGLNSLQQLEKHREGLVHKKAVEKKAASQGKQAEVPGRQSGMFYCGLCDISVPSSARLQQHVCSFQHQDRQAGKPTDWESMGCGHDENEDISN